MTAMQYVVGLIFIIASLFSTVAMADDVEGKTKKLSRWMMAKPINCPVSLTIPRFPKV